MELLLSFLITLLLFAGMLAIFRRGRLPVYRPSRRRVIQLLEGVISGQTSQTAWDLFIGMPINHDPLLEQARRRCIVVAEGDSEHPPFPSGLGDFLFNRAGRQAVGEILADLKAAIAEEPITKRF